ncbi:lysozyme [Deltaproteobacteria bacterium Smac51]|nr:lysozyme [Deltaproteobacteria bacterium Smac51]UQZ90525.1 lysozyme [Deltaproteobacteria bacterium Smac51]
MRIINALVVHCSATPPNSDIGAAEIRRVHVKQNKWRDIGYHYVIRRNGKVEVGRPEAQAGAHVSGHNADTLGICLVGGVDSKGRAEANYTLEQYETLIGLIRQLKGFYPKATIKGHRDFPGVKKDCPCFDVRTWAETVGLGWTI